MDIKDEIKKCKESPAYFYNKYVKLINRAGDFISKKEITDEEIKNQFATYLKFKLSRH